MSILRECYTLFNGVTIPKIGYGTWQIPDDAAQKCVLSALEVGYRHIDTALAYKNESGVGKAIKESGISREEIFITSKLPAEVKGYNEALDAFNQSINNLKVEYLDLYLIHAPWPWFDMGGDYTQGNIDSWRAFCRLYEEKKIRAIGVSNFSPSDIMSVYNATGIMPLVNQIAYHVGRTQDEYVNFCDSNNILVEAYSPMATGRALKDQYLCSVAEKYGVSTAQLLVRYALQKGKLPLPKSVTPSRIAENTKVDHFIISPEDMKSLDSIKSNFRD